MLVHTALDRVAQIARMWARSDCPVVIHVDAAVPDADFDALRQGLADAPEVSFSPRHRCDWGSWELVAATQDACADMLRLHPDVSHVYLTSGSCLPLRPAQDLVAYLNQFRDTDFIESVTTRDVSWIKGGLGLERFHLHFPFSWKKQRRLFDWSVRVQRKLGIKRTIPKGIVPHMGSQWWCLTAKTLSAILNDPNRKQYDDYFRGVWIPDESYFQSLARRHSDQIESRSLTFSKFDHQGKPYVFYDDHLQLLRRSDSFMARKIWPQANALYDYFLGDAHRTEPRLPPALSKIDRLFNRAMDRRIKGRAGLIMQSRFPNKGVERVLTARPYAVFQGFADLYPNFQTWIARNSDFVTHGHLFHPLGVQFVDGQNGYLGGLTDDAAIRDRNPQAFLTNLLWNGRSARHCFQFGPDDNQAIGPFMVRDGNATIHVISGAWAVPLFHADISFGNKRKIAANLQRIEAAHLKSLGERWVKARVTVWSLADFVQNPTDALMQMSRNLSLRCDGFDDLHMADLTGFAEFLQDLKNAGMLPFIMGEFPAALRGQNSPNPKNTDEPKQHDT